MSLSHLIAIYPVGQGVETPPPSLKLKLYSKVLNDWLEVPKLVSCTARTWPSLPALAFIAPSEGGVFPMPGMWSDD